MRVKRFKAGSMSDVLQEIRSEFGDNALILETRRSRGGLLGLTGGESVEVLAALDERLAPDRLELDSRLQAVRSLLQPRVEGQREMLAARLSESGVDESLIDAVLNACESHLAESRLLSVIAGQISVSPSLSTGNGARVALVGPTGVGKTTTIAKLAARYALTEHKKVALITMDTYRIGAVEQLKTYARLMGLPLDVVQSPEEMAIAVNRHSDKDLILIDTIGRSPQKSLQLAEIKAFLNHAEPTETHLVLSAPFGLAYLFQAAERFADLDANRIIVTKLDEIPRWGVVLSLVAKTGLPVSFVTDGQEVPRNLRPANAQEIALQIVGGVE